MSVRMFQGDCIERMKTLPDKSVDLFLLDLPYGCLTTESGKTKSNCAWDVKIELAPLWAEIERLMKNDHVPILHFCSTKFGNDLINSKSDWFRYDLVWHKTNAVGFLLANKMPLRSHENIYVFSKKGATYYRKDETDPYKKAIKKDQSKPLLANVYGSHTLYMGNDLPAGSRCSESVVTFSNKKAKGQHPTKKPDDLLAWLIERYSQEGDCVLDATAGSFGSVITAGKMGRHGIGIEKDEGFFQKAVALCEGAERVADGEYLCVMKSK